MRLLAAFVWLHWKQQWNALYSASSGASRFAAGSQLVVRLILFLLFAGLAHLRIEILISVRVALLLKFTCNFLPRPREVRKHEVDDAITRPECCVGSGQFVDKI